jgi:hypothetical protein
MINVKTSCNDEKAFYLKDTIKKNFENTHSKKSQLKGFKHANGFIKIYVQERELTKPGIRIHIWDPISGDANVHNHRWDMFSLVIKGSITSVEYDKDESGDIFKSWQYDPIYKGAYGMRHMGNESLQSIKETKLNVGDSYFLGKNVLHKVKDISNEGAITLMLTGNEEKDSKVKVFSEINQYEKENVNEMLASTQVDQILKSIQNYI